MAVKNYRQVTISIKPETLIALDDWRWANRKTRSQLIEEAIRQFLKAMEHKENNPND